MKVVEYGQQVLLSNSACIVVNTAIPYNVNSSLTRFLLLLVSNPLEYIHVEQIMQFAILCKECQISSLYVLSNEELLTRTLISSLRKYVLGEDIYKTGLVDRDLFNLFDMVELPKYEIVRRNEQRRKND